MSAPFSNYAELQDAIADWLVNRTDLVVQIPWFIRMGEASINRKLRTRQMVKRVPLLAEGRYTDLPEDWRKAWNIQRVEDDYPLEYRSPAEMDKLRYDMGRGQGTDTHPASFYSLLGDQIELLPSPTEEDPVEVEMLYYAKVPSLSTSAPSNWLLQAHPDLYLYAALVHTAPFLKEDERIPVWNELFAQALAEANVEDADARRSGSPMTRPRRGF